MTFDYKMTGFFLKNHHIGTQAPGAEIGFRGSLDHNSLQEFNKVHRTIRWRSISLLDHSAGTNWL